MTEVLVPFGDNQRDTATLLLAAVEESEDHEPGAVRIDTGAGAFVVPEEIAKAAGLDTTDPDADREAEIEAARGTTLDSQSVTNEDTEVAQQADLASDSPQQAPAKKAPAKKAPAKKSTAKKSTAKKSTAKKASN